MSTETIEVIPLGDDGETWFVTGTSDAHSAFQAAQDFDKAEYEGWGRSQLEGVDPESVGVKHRSDWGWVPVNPDYPDDEEQLVHGREGVEPVSGFLVTV